MAVHNFETRLAKKYGVPEAVMLWNLSYWQNQNEANQRNFHEGRFWTYNSVSAFAEIFEYLSEKQIQRILSKLEKEKVIISGRFNKMKIDRTKWYSVEKEIMAFHGFQPILPNGEMQRTKTSNAKDKNVQCILPNGEMDLTKRGNGFDQMGEPIPNNKTSIQDGFQFLFSSPSFSELYIDFLEMRKELKAKNTKRSETIILKKIEKLSEGKIENAILLLEQSIENSWKGIFALKNNTSFPYGKNSAGESKSLLEHNTKIAENVAEKLSKIDFDKLREEQKKLDPFA